MSAQAATPSAASAVSAAPPLALLCGASGFMGRHIACALRAAGWQVRPASRRSAPAVDYTRAIHASDWQPLLQGASAVINAVGVLRDSRTRPMQALHADAPCALFEACAASGVRRVIHISALGIDGGGPAARTPYARTKRQAEERLLALTAQGRLDGIALRPSLVFGAGGASTRLFLALARLPVLALPRCAFTARVQPLAVWDLAEAVARLAASSAASHAASHAANARPLTGLLELAGPQPLTLAAYIQQLRASQGRPPARWRCPPASPAPAPAWATRCPFRRGVPSRCTCCLPATWPAPQLCRSCWAAPPPPPRNSCRLWPLPPRRTRPGCESLKTADTKEARHEPQNAQSACMPARFSARNA